ncbi:hypothetical protein OOK13_45145 [Streptomyces sp. NBC_00378]|uniref:hypothetical protein n=1 Tax=Streptomyces sp. NBC_00378 TaxID=2975732 RepID=UPI002258604F|nr:hypothetical protein [Streptomyces sp. NBC_00378]MCX5115486.1 hypothetical protein [Streptomyces sp. NBC_00378]
MSNSPASRGDRARAFIPELIPDPVDLERTGPLDAREERDLERIHAARDHHGNARWMRGKALEAAFRRRLYRGAGERTRQEYLDDEWDGISESAAYREIQEWGLAARIAEAYGRPVAGSHVRALAAVAELHGREAVAESYVRLRRYGAGTGQRVTAEVVERLAEFLASDRALEAMEPEADRLPELGGLFTPRQLPAPRRGKKSAGPDKVVEPTVVIPKFGNDWTLADEQVERLSAWIATEAARSGMDPGKAADLLLDALTGDAAPLRPWADHAQKT